MKEKNAYFTLCLLWVMVILNSSSLQIADLPTEFKYLLLAQRTLSPSPSPTVPPPFLKHTGSLLEWRQGCLQAHYAGSVLFRGEGWAYIDPVCTISARMCIGTLWTEASTLFHTQPCVDSGIYSLSLDVNLRKIYEYRFSF